MQAFWIWLFFAAAVQADVLVLDGPKTSADLIGHIDLTLDPTHDLGVADVMDPAFDEWRPVVKKFPDVGYVPDAVWLRVSLRNATKHQKNWVVHYHENFKQIFDTWILRPDGTAEHILSQSLDRPFTDRPLTFPQLAAPFVLDPGQEAVILTRFWSEGSSILPLSVETQESFVALSTVISARNFTFYGLNGAFILAAIVGSFVFSSLLARVYAAYALCVLLYIMHGDGTAFQYIYPHLPRFNSVASVVWGGGFLIFAAIYTRIFLGTAKYYPYMDRALLGIVVTVLALWASMPFVDIQMIKKTFVFVALVAILTFAGSGIVVARHHFKRVRFFVLAWSGAVLSSLLMNLSHFLGVEIGQDVQYNSMRIVSSIDAGLMGLAILDRYNQMRNARQEALQASLATAERNLILTRRLNDLEQQFDVLDQASRRRDAAFADAIHDLRQPLQGLRLRIRNETALRSDGASHKAETDEGFDYLESLISGFLDETRKTSAPVLLDETDCAPLDLNTILSSVHEMFEADATDKGLTFRYVPTSLTTQADPLAVMRIVSNLVSNAIKYTEAGRIVLGCRRKGGRVQIEMHDTGPGMTAAEFVQARERDIRLKRTSKQAQGEGFGLAIAGDLAAAGGGALMHLTCRKQGCGIAVALPIGGAFAPKGEMG